MSNNANAILVPGTGQAYIAPVGTTLPADDSDPTAALDAAFEDLGYWTVDGLTLTITPDIQEIEAFQAQQAVRRSRKAQTIQAGLSLMEWNENTLVATLGGSVSAGAGGFYTYTPPAAGDALGEVSLVIDIQDGERNKRFIFPRGNTEGEPVEAKFTRDEAALLPMTFKGLEPLDSSPLWRMLSDDDVFNVNS